MPPESDPAALHPPLPRFARHGHWPESPPAWQEPAERARMRLHLAICETCRIVDEQFAFLRRAMCRLGEYQEAEGPADK